MSGVGGISSVELGRLVGGLGTGFMTSSIPLYLSEIAPSDMRGRFISTFALLMSLGQMVGYFITFASSYLSHSHLCWRLPWLIQFMICLLFALASWIYLPRSPRWLAKQNRHTEALTSLAILYHLPVDHKYIQKMYLDMRSHDDDDVYAEKSSFHDLFIKHNRMRTYIAFFISCANAMTGNVVIFYFAPLIFVKVMGNVSSSLALSGGVGLLSLLATTLSLFYGIDRYGRRVLFLVGSTLMGGCMFAIGILLCFFIDGQNDIVPTCMVIFFIHLFSTAYSGTWGVANYVYTAEIFTTSCRAKGLSLTYAISWAGSILLTFAAPYLFAYSISGVYFFFAFWSVVTLCGVYFIPETKGKALDDLLY
ncbi:MFS general substrate transporter [Backusella circina FSU 941]|nr:MFS general substrate transporter [Backusella circina FSU 941]